MLAIKRGYAVVCVMVIVSMVLNPFAPIVYGLSQTEPAVQDVVEEDAGDLAYELSIGSPSPILESAPNFSEEYAKSIAVQDEEPQVYPQIHLTVDPVLVIPGEPFSVTWTVSGVDDLKSKASLEGMHLAFEGTPAVQLASDQKMPAGAKESTMGFNMAPSSEKGQMNWTLNKKNIKSGEPNYLAVRLMDGEKEIISQAVYLAEPSFTVDAKTGGKIESANGRMSLEIPATAISEGLYMDIRQPSPHTAPNYSKTGHSIEVVAVGQSTRKNINKFSEDITVHMTYDEEDLKRGDPQDMLIYYFDETTNEWWPVETTVDEKTQTLTAKVNHLTVFDYAASTWQASRLPSLDAFQVSDFTGAGTYSVDFWTPSAPGDFQPSVSLNYSSQIIDDSVVFTQASWVGMGWSLDTGSIERNMHGTNSDLTDDTFQLSVGGISSQLLPISVSGTITTYATSEQSYWSMKFDSSTDTWEVWDQNGTKYAFNDRARTHTTNGCSTAANLNLTWRWSLSTATDKFNNVITYTYYNQPKSTTCANVLAVYPDKITWPNNRYRVNFVREARTDYQTAWEATAAKTNYSTFRLDKIQVQHSTDGSTWANIRQYDLTYSAGTTNQIYPTFTWTKGQRTLTLIGIQELSGDGSSTLPASTFYYTDKMHLDKVTNGQGGEVTLTYERWTYLDDDNDYLRSLYTEFGNQECNPSSTTWTVYNNYGSVKCEQYMLQLDKLTKSIAIARREFPEFIIKPGGQYRVAVYARSISGTTFMEYGFRNNLAGGDIQGSCTLTTTKTDCETGLEMPVAFNPIGTFLLIESPWAYIKRLQYMIMPLYYRVTTRVVKDVVTNQTGTYTYTYDGAAANDKEISASVAAVGSNYSLLYTPSLREYRGNAITRVKNPDGQVNTTWFSQSDALKGACLSVIAIH